MTVNQFLKLLLMTNDFYPGGKSATNTTDGLVQDIMSIALRGYSLIQGERPMHLIGRYDELFGQLAEPRNHGSFNTWVDIRRVMAEDLGIRLDAFKAVLFALYSSTVPRDGEVKLPRLGYLNPDTYFDNIHLFSEEPNRILRLVTTSPDEVREQHLSSYPVGIGNPMDLRILLRKPVIRLQDGSVAGISGQLLIQRYTCGLYWDIHDSLSNDANETPNRRLFQNFFGELHEKYGRETLKRIEGEQVRAGRQVRLLSEDDYLSAAGSNPDSLLIETIGRSNTRCTLFEFKVGRPRYMDSIVEGDVKAFEEDLSRKIEEGLNQEINFVRQLLNGQRAVTGLSPKNVTAWLFVIVVTDPFPSMGIFLESLQKKLAESSDLGNESLHGTLVLSLMELEQIEMIPKFRVSELLVNWVTSTHRDWPFNTYFAYHTKSQPISNHHVSALAEDEFSRIEALIGA
ncbi:MAG: hypothetical protein OXI16_10365 [Chloroflexota bacterium]|nr:hypothetical protein [Chloroflexota bacterium]